MFNATLTQLRPLSIGLDKFFKFADGINSEESNFPKYNIIKLDNTNYIIEMALAGYSKKDINITLEDSVITVSHAKSCPLVEDIKASKDSKIIHQGITKKSFSKFFAVAETIIVTEASFIDGLLTIKLEDVIPEEKKGKTIHIN